MGGYAAGEVASAAAVQRIMRIFGDLREGSLADRLRQAVQAGNLDVYRAAQEPDRRGMGSTVVCAAIDNGQLVSAHVGDSRLYRLRGAMLDRLTHDHSLVQARVDSGLMTMEEAEAAGNRNIITRALGLQPEVDVEIGEHGIAPGDRFLLCTDGLSGQVRDQEIQELIAFARPDEACRRLIALANERGGPDNITAVIVALAASDAELDDKADGHPTQELPVPTAPTREITVPAVADLDRAAPAVDGEATTVPSPPASEPATAAAVSVAGPIPAEHDADLARPAATDPPPDGAAPSRDSGPLTSYFTLPPPASAAGASPESPPLQTQREPRRSPRALLVVGLALVALVVAGEGYRYTLGAPTAARPAPSPAATTPLSAPSQVPTLLPAQATASPLATLEPTPRTATAAASPVPTPAATATP
jgi:protein phosphatase